MTSVLHHHVRAGVLIGWVLAWNALFGIGIWMNGGFAPLPGSPMFVPISVACFGSAVFAVLIACSGGVQALVLRVYGDVDPIRRELWFIAFVTAVLGVGAVVQYSLGSQLG
jgi:hypothetical protein